MWTTLIILISQLLVIGRASAGTIARVTIVTLARRLADRPDKAARWIGKDALRDLLRLAPCFEQVEPGELFLCFGEGTNFTEIFEPFPDAESATCAYP